MPLFPDSFLRELAERNDIVEVVSEHVALTKRSGTNMFGLCPFHSEKTPSFSVSPERQFYHCFGCGKGGSVIDFVMEVEKLPFQDAVQHLARRAGMTVPEEDGDRDTARRRARLYELNREAARFFYGLLIGGTGGRARQYLDMRGISAATARIFGLGFAPDSWDTLARAMKQKGFSEEELVAAGLARSGKKGGVYDLFRDRLVFPVIDIRGQVIGFSGRILGDGEPKYLNTPETGVFSKSRNLYALNLANKSKSGYIILTEGNIDVVALHQAGFDSAVASLGTSLTPEQARLISRYVDRVIISYDADNAGLRAANRAIGILEKLNINVRVLRLDGAKDPDEFIKRRGAAAFRNLIEKSENHIEYRLKDALRKHDVESDEGRVGFLKEATELVASLPGVVEREVYGMRVAEISKVSGEAVAAEVRRIRSRLEGRKKRDEERESMRVERNIQPESRNIRYDNVRSAAAEEGIIRLLCLEPALFAARDDLPAKEDFSSEFLARLFETLLERTGRGEEIHMTALSSIFSPEEMSHLTGIIQKPESLSQGERALGDYIEIIKSESAGSARQDLREIARALREKKGYGN